MSDIKIDQPSAIAYQAHKDLGEYYLSTGEPLLSSEAGDIILSQYEQGMTDKLTGLLNKLTWNDEARHFYSFSKREGIPFSVLYLDINSFKTEINDKYSHEFGDEVLKLVSEAIKRSIRSSDVAGRVGGDEFAIALVGADDKATLEVQERIKKTISELVAESEIQNMREVNPTVTIGSETDNGNYSSLEDMVNQADLKMLELKKVGNHGR